MSILRGVMSDRVALIKSDGKRFDNLPASVQSEKLIITDNPQLPIEDGDQFERRLPSGVVETFIVLNAGFQQGLSAMPSHYQSKVRKITANTSSSIDPQRATAEGAQSPYVQNFFAAVGNVAQGGHHFSQTANMGTHPEDLARFINELKSRLDELNLDLGHKHSAQSELAILEGQLAEPNPSIVKEAGTSLRNITEGAIGGLLSTVGSQPSVCHWISQMLASF